MRWFYLWFRSLFLRSRLDSEMRDEMATHIEQATARNIARGMLPAEAARAAQREFGNDVFIQEQARDARGMRWVDTVRGDVRFAFRQFRRTRLSTVTMVVVLALGIGANVALFTSFHSLRTNPGPGLPRDEARVRIRGTAFPTWSDFVNARDFSYQEVVAYGQQRRLFSAVAAVTGNSALFAPADPQRPAISGGAHYVTDGYFEVLRLPFALGRGLAPTPLNGPDQSTVLTAVITDSIWEQVFDRAPDVIGRTFRVNNTPVTVVGVAPRGFLGTASYGHRIVAFLPLAAYPIIEQGSFHVLASPDSARFTAIARLRAGVTAEQAQPTVRAIAQRAVAARTDDNDSRTISSSDVVPLLMFNGRPRDDQEMTIAAAALGALTFLILLVTCTNVSSLLVGIASARRREMAVRLSLGAGRRRLIGQLLTESLLLALAATLTGLFVFWIVVRAVTNRFPDGWLVNSLTFDWPAVIFTIGFALLTSVLFGLSPALHATRLALADVLKESATAVAGSRARLQRALVVAQITLTQPLLVGAGAVMLATWSEIERRGATELNARTAFMQFDTYSGIATVEERRRDLDRVKERLAALPGVAGVAAETYDYGGAMIVHPADRIDAATLPDSVRVRINRASPGWLTMRDIRIVRGRDFAPADMDTIASTVIVGDQLARGLFGDADPIGRRVRFPRTEHYLTIVGVVDQEAITTTANPEPGGPEPPIFLPLRTRGVYALLIVRTHAAAAPLLPMLRTNAAAVAPQVPVSYMQTVNGIREIGRRDRMRGFAGIGAGGVVALFLAAIGIYAVVAFAVGQRTREIGIRTALGAQRREVVGLFFGAGVRLSLLGLIFGLPLSLIALRIIAQQTGLPAVSTVFIAASVAFGVLAVAGIATWVPARRAASVDPLTALRSE